MVVRRNLEPGSDIIGQTKQEQKLLGDVRISEVQGKPVASRSRKVLLHTMNTDELNFSTTLRFPVVDGYRLAITLYLNRKAFCLIGTIGSRTVSGNLYKYGFIVKELSVSRSEWIKELNDWLLRHAPASSRYKAHYLYRS